MAARNEMATRSETAPSLRRLHAALMETLYDEQSGKLGALLARIEAKTNVKREQLLYALGGLFAIYMVLGHFAQLVCNTIGFAYPAYASVKAIRTDNKDDDTQWLTYWTVFAVFSLFDFFGESIMRVFPFYWLLKCAFLLYLCLPQLNGAQQLYRDVVDPAVTKLEYMYHSRHPTVAPAGKSTHAGNGTDETY
uniref:Receptor expression-enhancing protein n=1 Tax=Plectus sambesii TaxID=2011161 RepID=A0A914WJ56_9BILA